MKLTEFEHRAEDAMNAGDFSLAADLFARALGKVSRNEPERARTLIRLSCGLATSLLARGRADKALQALTQLAQDGLEPEAHKHPAYRELLASCRDALDAPPRPDGPPEEEVAENDWTGALKRADRAFARGDYQEALLFYARSARANPIEAGTSRDYDRAREGEAKARERLAQRKP
ncbi:MAG: hypothetical protein AB1921_09930 [Thermodesulfobacteriota bacterium]